jgi:hypothetical protein
VHKDVAGSELALHLALLGDGLTVLLFRADLFDHLDGDQDLAELVVEPELLDAVLKGGLGLVLEARVGVDDVPLVLVVAGRGRRRLCLRLGPGIPRRTAWWRCGGRRSAQKRM